MRMMIFPLSVVCYMDDYFRFNDSLQGRGGVDSCPRVTDTVAL